MLAYSLHSSQTNVCDRTVTLRQITNVLLRSYAQTLGRTWLDEELTNPSGLVADKGYGKTIQAALKKRMQYLAQQKILSGSEAGVTRKTLAELERRDLQNACEKISKQLGKHYAAMPASGKVGGVMLDSLERTSGKYAVIERAQDFTLVPWRDVLGKRRGMDISGQVRNGRINWQLGKQKKLGIN